MYWMGCDPPMPKMRLAFHVAAALCATAALGAPLELRVEDVGGKPVAGSVVMLRSTDPGRPLLKPVDATMDQVDRKFVPHVLMIPTGSKVSFPNNDTVRHQVHSFSPVKRFELPLYRGNAHRPQLFDRPGVVTVGCNIHDGMRAYIYVLDAHYFGRTDASGNWKLPDVQPGTYTVHVWNPRTRDTRPIIEQRLTITAAEPRAALRVVGPLKLRPDSNVPTNWDAY